VLDAVAGGGGGGEWKYGEDVRGRGGGDLDEKLFGNSGVCVHAVPARV
jgi:hypothetical protein